MHAAVFRGRRDVRVQTWPDPLPPRRGEVQLAVRRAAICGTDVEEFRSGPHLVPLHRPHPVTAHAGPLVLGHEIVGQVIAAGDDVGGLQLGQRVVPCSGVWCGQCTWCAQGRTNLCVRYYTIGLHTDGGLAERVNVPARICRSVAACSDDDLAVLAQPLAVALHAFRRLPTPAGTPLVVVGVGGIGALLVTLCCVHDIPTVAVDVSPVRLTTAARLGATVVESTGGDATAAVRRAVGDEGADVVVECSGTAAGLATAIGSVRRGGLVQLVGLHRDPTPMDLTRLVLDEISISTSKVYLCAEELPAAVDLLAAHGPLFASTTDTVIALEDVVPAGFARMAAGGSAGRVVVRP